MTTTKIGLLQDLNPRYLGSVCINRNSISLIAVGDNTCTEASKLHAENIIGPKAAEFILHKYNCLLPRKDNSPRAIEPEKIKPNPIIQNKIVPVPAPTPPVVIEPKPKPQSEVIKTEPAPKPQPAPVILAKEIKPEPVPAPAKEIKQSEPAKPLIVKRATNPAPVKRPILKNSLALSESLPIEIPAKWTKNSTAKSIQINMTGGDNINSFTRKNLNYIKVHHPDIIGSDTEILAYLSQIYRQKRNMSFVGDPANRGKNHNGKGVVVQDFHSTPARAAAASGG